ncbi:MAG: redoxin domain-containing protein [Bacteroidetes bacterium]|nr:redoxin domain-containing protein [Bacteroidota bacterium]
MKIIFSIPVFFILYQLSAQIYHLDVTVRNLPSTEIYLAGFYGEKNNIIDTVIPDKEGNFSFTLNADYNPGMYRIFFDKKVFIDVVFNHENTVIVTDYKFPYDSLEVISSVENRLYYDFLRNGNDYRRKFDLLAPLNDYYPRGDSFFIKARKQYIMVQAAFFIYIDSILNQYPDAWVSKIIRQKKPLFYDPSLDEYGRREYIMQHYFDNIDFTDVGLIRSNFYTTVAIEYMSLFSNPNLTQSELEEEFIKAVDTIMAKASENGIVYEFMVDYLVKGFERYHFDKVLDYIAEHYSPQSCENEERKTDLQTRLEKYAELSEGKAAPDFSLQGNDGKIIHLNEIKADYTLILFWASWCPHCAETLPEIEKIYKNTVRNKLEIIAVSLDKEKTEWQKALDEQNFSWKNGCDFLGWDSPVAIDYNVYATPTMFLLNPEKKIFGKPITLNELRNFLAKAKIEVTVQ